MNAFCPLAMPTRQDTNRHCDAKLQRRTPWYALLYTPDEQVHTDSRCLYATFVSLLRYRYGDL